MLYVCVESYHKGDIEALEKVQKRATKILLELKYLTYTYHIASVWQHAININVALQTHGGRYDRNILSRDIIRSKAVASLEEAEGH